MGWTARSGRYSARRWYCGVCRQRTPLELNQDWTAAGNPLQWEGPTPWEWFTRCGYCHTRQYDEGNGDCPRCGTPAEWPDPWQDEAGVVHYEGGTLLEMSKPERNISYSLNYGVTGHDWQERHQCRLCRHRWWMYNSDC